MHALNIIQTPAQTIAEMVASDYRKAGIFNRFGIDFCCGGKKTLSDVCREKNIDQAAVEQALTALPARAASGVHWDFNSWRPAFLIEFIVQAHHAYVRAQGPKLLAFGEKVARTHGQAWPETIEILQDVKALLSDLEAHMQKEEMVLFPYLTRLFVAEAQNLPSAPFGAVDNPIHVMEAEHEDAGELLRRIRVLSGDFTPPEGACNTFRVWYALLQEFEENLHLHVHLENNILFPKAIGLERQLRGN